MKKQKKEKKIPLRGFSLRRYVVTLTPLRVLLTTPGMPAEKYPSIVLAKWKLLFGYCHLLNLYSLWFEYRWVIYYEVIKVISFFLFFFSFFFVKDEFKSYLYINQKPDCRRIRVTCPKHPSCLINLARGRMCTGCRYSILRSSKTEFKS